MFDLYEENDGREDWVLEIIKVIFTEFAEYKEDDKLTFYTWW